MRRSRGPSGDLPDEIIALAGVGRPAYVDPEGRLVGRPFVTKVHAGVRFVAVGYRIFRVAPEATVHDFLEMYLATVLGPPWIAREQAKPLEQRHPIMRWHSDLLALKARPPAATHGGVHEADVTGSVMALLTLAWDTYAVEHTGGLHDPLVRRLRHREEFQGARYELAVAALFARVGFEVDWIHDTTRKRPEFVATHLLSGERIAVEAKSRRRPGVLAHPGVRNERVRADLDHLLDAALVKETDGLPYAIFIDANLPPSAQPQGWLEDLKAMLDARPEGTPATPDPFTGITITNFAWHYLGDGLAADGSGYVLVVPRYPRVPLRDSGTLPLLAHAAEQYGSIPSRFPND